MSQIKHFLLIFRGRNLLLIELRENEYNIFSLLKKLKATISLDEILKNTGLNESTVIKALLNLSKNKLVSIIEEKNTFLKNGKLLIQHLLGIMLTMLSSHE